MNLDGGARGVQEIPVTPSTLVIAQSGRKFGSWDPSVTSIEQRSWHGGRGQDDFSEDPTQFFDSQSLWTMTPGKIHNGLQWKFASIGRNGHHDNGDGLCIPVRASHHCSRGPVYLYPLLDCGDGELYRGGTLGDW